MKSGSIGNRSAMRKYGIQGHGTITEWRRKYGIFDIENTSQVKSMQSPEQKLKELEQKVKQLERHDRYLEERLNESEDKASILDKVIESEKTPSPINPRNKKDKKNPYCISKLFLDKKFGYTFLTCP